MKYLAVAIIVVAAMSACNDSQIAQFTSLGAKHQITCYSGDKVIYEGESTGNISNEHQPDGWYWRDSKTNKLVEATGPCIILQE